MDILIVLIIVLIFIVLNNNSKKKHFTNENFYNIVKDYDRVFKACNSSNSCNNKSNCDKFKFIYMNAESQLASLSNSKNPLDKKLKEDIEKKIPKLINRLNECNIKVTKAKPMEEKDAEKEFIKRKKMRELPLNKKEIRIGTDDLKNDLDKIIKNIKDKQKIQKKLVNDNFNNIITNNDEMISFVRDFENKYIQIINDIKEKKTKVSDLYDVKVKKVRKKIDAINKLLGSVEDNIEKFNLSFELNKIQSEMNDQINKIKKLFMNTIEKYHMKIGKSVRKLEYETLNIEKKYKDKVKILNDLNDLSV